MSAIRVDAEARILEVSGRSIVCSIGRSGACDAAHKAEGDGCTPRGEYPIRTVLFRPGRAAPPAGMTLPWRWVRAQDGWSDDPADPLYNRPVTHPWPYSAERLAREDGLYDVIVILGHNDAPPVPGRGSAIFLHCAVEGRPTEGCVAIAREELLRILPELRPGDRIAIR